MIMQPPDICSIISRPETFRRWISKKAGSLTARWVERLQEDRPLPLYGSTRDDQFSELKEPDDSRMVGTEAKLSSIMEVF